MIYNLKEKLEKGTSEYYKSFNVIFADLNQYEDIFNMLFKSVNENWTPLTKNREENHYDEFNKFELIKKGFIENIELLKEVVSELL